MTMSTADVRPSEEGGGVRRREAAEEMRRTTLVRQGNKGTQP